MTPQQAATLTTDQLRDWCAEDDGWTRVVGVPGFLKEDGDLHLKWKLRHHEQWDHPHPPTRDGAAKAMPEGWRWQRWGPYYSARRVNPQAMIRLPVGSRLVEINDTGDEIADRYRLAVLCRLAEKEAKG